jgi:hypothetical protein
MQERRFYSTLDKNIALSFKMGGAEMGSILEGSQYDLRILASDGDGESFSRVMLFRNGHEIHTWEIDTPDVDLTLPLNTFDGEYSYIKVTQADGDEAISSPIYMRGGVFNTAPTCYVSLPSNGTHFATPQSITITAEASDEDGSIASVEFFVDGVAIGIDTLAPYSINFIIPSNGAYEKIAEATDDNGSWITSDPVAFTVGEFSKTESSRIDNGMDDVEEKADGSIYSNSSDIELVYDGSNQIIGLRFAGLNIPPRAVIESLFIQFTTDEVSSGTCILSIKGHYMANSPPFTNEINNVSGRLTTVAEVNWEPAEWPAVGAAGPDQQTPDLSAIIQELVNHPGYTQSSAITIIITGGGERTAEAYEGDAGAAALLTVDYRFGIETGKEADFGEETEFRIFPNPVTDGTVTIQTWARPTESISVSIADLTGRICFRSNIEKREASLDLSGFKPGLYIMYLSDGNRTFSGKLIVKKP